MRQNGNGNGGGTLSAGKETGRRRLGWFFAVLTVVLAAWSATSGLEWSQCFHPDELTIVRWIDVVHRQGYLPSRAYPGGWFELFRVQHWFDQRVPRWIDAWRRHRLQDGPVDALREETFALRTPPAAERKDQHTIPDGRKFNAWLYVATAALLYAACLEAGFHPAAAFASGLFFLGSPWPLEFSHYCETDGGLLVSMAFFAWLAARALRKGSAWTALAAACAAGFAVSCKPTLTPLLLWCVWGPAVALWGRRAEWGLGRWLGTVAGVVLAGAGLALCGYLAGTPALRIDPDWYFHAMRRDSLITFREVRRNLGGAYTWWGAATLRAQALAAFLGEWGVLPLGWGLFSWGFWFSRRFRRQLAGVPGLLPAFVPFWLCCCPFVRRQELLPLAVLLSMGAALPVQWWFGGGARAWGARGWRRWGIAAAAAAFGAAAFASQAAKGLSMASCFRFRDTRVEAQNWLRDSIPRETPLALDAYVEQVARGVPCRAMRSAGLPFLWEGTPPEKEGEAARYFVEQPGFAGRLPIRNPKTGRMHPEAIRNAAAYGAAVYPVRTWKASRETPVPVFGQRPVRLVSFDLPGGDAFDVPIGGTCPILVQPDGTRLYGAAGPAGVGPHRAVHTVGKRSWVHLNLEDGERWLVTRWLEGEGGAVSIVREGLFRPRKAELAAGKAVAARLAPSPGDRLAARLAAHAGGRCRMRGDDQTVFCASYLAQSAAEAARELRLAGDARAALALLRDSGELDDAGRVEAFCAASALGESPEPEWVEAARKAVAAAERLEAERETVGRAGATLCGVPLGIVEDFARVRMGRVTLEPGAKLPLWLPPGRYGLSVRVRGGEPPGMPKRLFAFQTGDFGTGELSGECREWTVPLEVRAGQFARVAGGSGDGEGFAPFEADLEITWSPVENMAEAAEAIRAALRGSGLPPTAEIGKGT